MFARRWPFDGDTTGLIRCLIRLDALSEIASKSDARAGSLHDLEAAIGHECIYLVSPGMCFLSHDLEPAHNIVDMDDPYFYL